MHPTLETLDGYYNSPLGMQHAAFIAAKLKPWLNNNATARVLGLGYVAPYLDSARVVDDLAGNPRNLGNACAHGGQALARKAPFGQYQLPG
jgi:methylaspartate ammonia-lyase